MKKLILVLAVCLGLVAPVMAAGGNAVQGYVVTGSTFQIAGTFTTLRIPTSSKISSTTISNSEITDMDFSVNTVDPAYPPQTVSIYTNIGSSTEASCIWSVTIASGTAINSNIYSKHFDPALKLLKGLYMNTSTALTSVIGSIGVR